MRQPLHQEVLLTIQATPNEIIALNYVLQSFLRFHEDAPQKRHGTVHAEVVPLIHRLYQRIGTSDHRPKNCEGVETWK